MPVPEPDPMNPDEPVQPEKTSKPVKSDRTKSSIGPRSEKDEKSRGGRPKAGDDKLLLVTVSLSPEDFELLDKYSELTQRQRSQAVRFIVSKWLKTNRERIETNYLDDFD